MFSKVILVVLFLTFVTCQNSSTTGETFFRKARTFWRTPVGYHIYHDTLEPNESFDFIIVGSGSSGSVLANRLSEINDWKILLLEVGDLATSLTNIPASAPLFQRTKLDWGYIAEKENGTCWGCPNQRMNWPRGRALGGSTVINYMIHVRGNRHDYDKWEALGNPGWAYKDVLPYFKKLEDAKLQIKDTEYRNCGGPMTVSDVPFRTESVNAFVKAAQQAGYPYVDYNGKSQIGVSYVQGTIKNGLRVSVESAYLRPIRDRKNLKILLNSRVTKILIDQNKKAYGVQFVRNRKYYNIIAKKEVILSAGALNSPQLLMLSGVGPTKHLQDLGIKPIVNLPVGRKLYDHLTFIGLTFIVNEPIVVSAKEFENISNVFEVAVNGRGPLTSLGGVESLLYFKTNISKEKSTYPDMEAIFVGSSIATDSSGIFASTLSVSTEMFNKYWKDTQDKYTFQVLLMLVHPKSYGYLKLKSKNSFHWPLFYPKYFTDTNKEDIKTFIASIREIQRISKMPAMQKYGTILYQKPLPGCEKYHFDSDSYWECALRTASVTLHHQTTTCKMGPKQDREAVVDHRLRVHGIKNLRVIDTSVIPIPLAAHTSIPAVMIGEKAADIIKEDWFNKT